MFTFDIVEPLKKKLRKLAKKDPVLAKNFKKKLLEVINSSTIERYKNLKSPQQHYKRIHLTDNFILLFTVQKKEKHILFVDILHWDKAYRK